MRDVVLAWDIDGTLLHTTGESAGKCYIAAAAALGVTSPVIDTHGKTDLGILAEIVGLDRATEALPLFTDIWLANCPVPECHPLAGVLATLSRPWLNVTHVIVSGNVPRRAHAKLAAAGLHHFFDFDRSAFGDESAVRADLVVAATARCAGSALVIIGDTPRDIAAARAAGVPSVGVATGAYNVPSLVSAGADLVIPDLIHGADDMVAFVAEIR